MEDLIRSNCFSTTSNISFKVVNIFRTINNREITLFLMLHFTHRTTVRLAKNTKILKWVNCHKNYRTKYSSELFFHSIISILYCGLHGALSSISWSSCKDWFGKRFWKLAQSPIISCFKNSFYTLTFKLCYENNKCMLTYFI